MHPKIMVRDLLAFAVLYLLITIPNSVSAQAPVAAFSANKTTGCSPVVVQFTDLSTGTPTSWYWDLGNGGNSSLKNPSTTYFAAGTYRVILTASNSNGSTKDTAYITVHASPTLVFTADTITACGSKTAQFNNTSTPGAGGAVNYLWDFGDGSTSTATNPSHVYTYPGSFAVSLVATNSNGCTSTLTKPNYIKVVAKPAAGFVANKTSGCNTPFQVNFTNSTTGAVSYNWKFGDGNISTAANPTHTYTTSGNFSVTLVATASNGCKDTFVRSSYISVGQVIANFTTNTPICAGSPVYFTNTTTPGTGTSRSWQFGNGGTSTAVNPSYTYSTPGTYTVTLVETYDVNCVDTVSKNITVNPSPVVKFSTPDTVGCSLPFTVHMTNSTTGATSYLWNFGYGGTSTATNPTHTYSSNWGPYPVTLTATNSAGCSSSLTKSAYIKVTKPVTTLTASPTSSCVNSPIQFNSTFTSGGMLYATNYRWDFGDGSSIVNCATCTTQTHSYTTTGTYTVKLIVSTSASCKDTVTQVVTIKPKPVANFTGSPLVICPDGVVNFTNTSTGATSYLWNFGDGGTSTLTSPSHIYDRTNSYDVTLIASNDGCKDTLKRNAYVTVQLPLADFKPTFECSTRLKYTFIDKSQGANTYSWDFGDGNTSTTGGNVSHTYSTAGTYTVVLKVKNTATGCTDSFAQVINAQSIILPTFTVNDTTICKGNLLMLTRAGSTAGYTYTSYFGSSPNYSQANLVAWHANSAGVFDMKIVVTDALGCKDSVVKKNYIKVGGPDVSFTASDLTPCKEDKIIFDDNTTSATFAITSRVWDFGDGIQEPASTDTIHHKYNNTGPYSVKLTVTDANGCKDDLKIDNYVYVYKPVAQFYTNDTSVCAGSPVKFQNNSGGADFTSAWTFGDGNTSTSITPTHTYNAIGNYTVKLVLVDAFGCKDSATKVNYIKVQKPTAAFTLSDTAAPCPPLSIMATNSSTGAANYTWTFGNNNQSILANPSITYTYPGVYTVKLIATNGSGCKDSTSRTVKVNGPTGSYSYAPAIGCNPLTVNFTAASNSTTSFIWDMNNGVTQTTNTPSFSYTYTQAGRYVPRLILSDGGTCQVPLQNDDTVVVDNVVADFNFVNAGNICSSDTVYFNDTIISTNSTILTRSWDFGDGKNSTAADPNHFYAAAGTYQVKLIIGNTTGCKDTIVKTVVIHGLPGVNITAAADSICPGQLTGLQLSASGATSYSWSPATGLSCTNCPNPVANPQTVTRYIVTGTDANGCSAKDTFTIGIKSKPVIVVSNDTSICGETWANLSATGASSLTWSPATGLSCINCTNPVASPAGNTTYTIIGANSSGCKDTAVVTVTVMPKPVVVSNGTVSLCNGDSILLNATGAAGYIWSPGAGLSCTGCPSPSARPTSNTTYTVVGTSANGCKDTATTTVNVNGLPNVSAGSDVAICTGSNTSLQATGASNYTWTPATGLSCTNCANPTANPTTTTTYTVIGANGSSCKDTATVKVTVNSLPVVSAGADKSLCMGTGVSLQGIGATTYSWTPATDLSCSNCAAPTATPSATTTYTVTGTDANGCKDTGVVKLTVNSLPVVSGGGDKDICPGDSVSLQGTGATSYIWTPATGLSCTNCVSPKASPAVTTTYTITGTDGNGCKNTSTVKVSVNAQPNVSAGSDVAICTGSNTSLQATGASNYTWTPATGLSCTNCANPTANPTTTTTYTVIGANGSSCKDTATVKVTVNSLPVVSAGADKSLCMGTGVSLQGIGATTYSWTPATDLSCSNCAAPTATPSATTTYTVTGTDANGCKDTGVVKLTVNSLPVVSGGSDKTVCLGDSTQLQGSGAVSYAWSPATGLSCTNCTNPKASPSVTTVYTVTGTDANGCKNISTVKVTVNTQLVITAANKDVCKGSNVQLNASGAVSYKWTPATGLSCTNCPNPVANPAASTTYTITGTDANGCKGTTQSTVTVNKLPNVNAGSNASICLKDSVQLQVSGAVSYAWTSATGLSCVNCPNPKASPAVTTTYTVSGTDANGCVNTVALTVTVKSLPNVDAGNDVAICAGASTVLKATGADSYIWSPSNNLSCTNCASPSANPAAGTNYVVTGTGTNGCKAADTVNVKVNALPVVSILPVADICAGDSVKLEGKGAMSYIWTPSAGLSCTTCPDPKAAPAITATYLVAGTDANGCKNTASTQVVVKPLPVVTATAARDLICGSDTTQLTATGAQSYSWSPIPGLSCINCASPVATVSAATTYFVIGTTNGCTDTAQVMVDLRSAPVVNAGPDVAYCTGYSDSLSATGALTYTWSPAAGLSCTTCDNPAVNTTKTTVYTLTGTDEYGCTNTDNVTVTVHDLPNVNAGEDKNVCEGSTVQLLATGAANYLWSPADGLSCVNCPNPLATTTSETIFSVKGTDANGCVNTDDVKVTVILKKPVSFSPDDSICIGEAVELYAGGGSSYIWSADNAVIEPLNARITVSPAVTTTYSVVIKQGECFTDTARPTVYVFNLPEIDAGEDRDVKGGAPTTLRAVSNNVAKYEWSPAEDMDCPDCSNPVVSPTKTTLYHVKVTSDFGCVAEDEVTLRVTCGPDQLFIANTFTPNNDGVNDMFFPQGHGLNTVQRFSVYSRWGELLYDANNIPLNNPTYGWNGTYKSEPLKPDVFVYIIRATCEDGKPIEIKGDISLIR